jgi:hypothetical protein
LYVLVTTREDAKPGARLACRQSAAIEMGESHAVRRTSRAFGIVLVLALAAVAPGLAIDTYTFTVSVQGGLGGTLDSSGTNDYQNRALQASVGMLTADRTFATLRVGRLQFGRERAIDGLLDPKVEYAVAAGEYRFRQPAYDFGLFAGLGYYRLTGDPAAIDFQDQDAIGFALGFTGDFDMTRRLSFVAELDFHYAFFDETNIYGVALAGLALHF